MNLKNLIKLAYVSLSTESDSNKVYPTIQVTYHDTPHNAVRASIYGLVSIPPKDSTSLTLAAYGQESTLFAFSDDYRNRFKGLKEGEVLLGNYTTSSYTFYDSSGNAKVFSKEGIASVVGSKIYLGSKDVSLIGKQIEILEQLLLATYPSAVGPAGPMASPFKDALEAIKTELTELSGSYSAEEFDTQ